MTNIYLLNKRFERVLINAYLLIQILPNSLSTTYFSSKVRYYQMSIDVKWQLMIGSIILVSQVVHIRCFEEKPQHKGGFYSGFA